MIVPKQVIIEVTSRCNLSCKFCPSTCDDSYRHGDMSLEFFKSIVDRIDFDATVIPWMNGEPFLNADYLEMVKYLNQKGKRFYVTTNLTIWREEVLRELLRPGSGCYQLIVSMDGIPGSRSIEKARPGTDEARLLSGVNRLLRMKADLDSPTNIAFKICERGQDWAEIEEYIQYWLAEDAVDYICVGKPLKDLNEECMRTHPCQYFDHNFMVIRWDGNLPICAYNDAAANRLELSYGRLGMHENLLEVYNNASITALRTDQNNGIYHGPCKLCGFAYTGRGFHGEKMEFRDDPGNFFYFQQDYYNSFYSKKRDWKPNSYYGGLDSPKGDKDGQAS